MSLAIASSNHQQGAMMINIRDLSIKCGRCGEYQTLCRFEPDSDHHVYVYECDNDVCDAASTRTLVEVPKDLDAFATRDPKWRGGGRHGASGVNAENG